MHESTEFLSPLAIFGWERVRQLATALDCDVYEATGALSQFNPRLGRVELLTEHAWLRLELDAMDDLACVALQMGALITATSTPPQASRTLSGIAQIVGAKLEAKDVKCYQHLVAYLRWWIAHMNWYCVRPQGVH